MKALEVQNASIRYITGDFKDIGLKEYVTRHLTHNYSVTEFWADRNVSFSLEKGDMLGIIGSNGAGKSTLLKAISGIMEPTHGIIRREGSVAALLELGSGFDGDLTVRENTYLRGAMLGYTRKFMDETYDSIIEFAELQNFQDRPFKQLSSGMQSRLAFSIASLVRPDILILDEVLSVGDGAFKKKSEDKMKEIISGGATTILVTHSIDQVREMCNKVLWLYKGEQIAFGEDVQGICDRYEEFLSSGNIRSDICRENDEGERTQEDICMQISSEAGNSKTGRHVRVALLVTLLLMMCGIICYLNINRLMVNADTDYIAEINYGRQIWEKKSLLPDNWVMGTEMMFGHPAILFPIFFALTSNYLLSYSLVLIATMILFILSATFFLRSYKVSWDVSLLGILLLLSFGGIGRPFIVLVFLYYGYYSFYIDVVLLTMGYLVRVYDRQLDRIVKPSLAGLCFVALALGFVGFRMMFFLYIPLLLTSLWALCNDRNATTIHHVKRTSVLFLFNLLGIISGHFFLSDVEISASILGGLRFASFSEIPQNFWKNVVAMLEAIIGTGGGMQVFTADGVDMVVKACVALVCVWLLLWMRRFFFHDLTFRFFLANLAVTFAITTLTSFGSGASFYYFLVPCLEIYILCRYLSLSTSGETMERCTKTVTVALALLMVASNTAFFYGREIQEREPNAPTVELVDWLRAEDIHSIYASFWVAGPIEAYSNGDIAVGYMVPEEDQPNDIMKYIWLNSKENYSTDISNLHVILNDAEEELILNNPYSKLSTHRCNKVAEIGNYNIYQFDRNPDGAFILPPIGESRTYSPSSCFIIISGELLEDGSAISDGTEGYFVTGPYIHVDDGIYDIEMSYEVEQYRNPEAGYIDVSCDSGSNVLGKTKIIVSDVQRSGTAVISGVTLRQLDNVEFRAFAYEGSMIKITSVKIIRK